ncbi:hypothetical protein ACHAXS_008591 [Conticribra weissflogii]
MVKHRKKRASSSSSSSSSSSKDPPSMTMSSLLPRTTHTAVAAHNEFPPDANGKGRKPRSRILLSSAIAPSLLRSLLVIVRRLLSAATGPTPFAVAAIVASSSPLSSHGGVGDDRWQAGKWSAWYLFVARPLADILSVVVATDADRTERIVAAAFLLAVAGAQLSKAGNAAVASAAVCLFGLASRRLAMEEEGEGEGKGAALEEEDGDDDDETCDEDNHHGGAFPSLRGLWRDSTVRTRATLSTLAVVASLLFENFLIWVVSATYRPGIDGSPEPLQDNGRWALEALAKAWMATAAGHEMKATRRDYDASALDDWIKKALQKLRSGLNVQWALVAGFGASLVCLELKLGRYQEPIGGGVEDYYRRHRDGYHQQEQQQHPLEVPSQQHMQQQHTQPLPSTQPSFAPIPTTQPPSPFPFPLRFPRTLAGLALRSLLTLSAARLIRTLSFTLTVLPSQIPRCYPRRFPHPPPADWPTWLRTGFLPQTRGGCNDLILSGHATVTSTLACALTSVAGNGKFARAVWTLVAVDYAIEALEGLHYSVDMWLGCVVTCLLWVLTNGVEREGEKERRGLMMEWRRRRKRRQHEVSSKMRDWDATVVGMYALPAILGFFVLTVVPEAYVNYFLVGYALWAGGIVVRWGQTNYSQHILLCLLYVTLGTYL